MNQLYRHLIDDIRNVGLFRYWTVANIPLFALATPMLVALISTSVMAIYSPRKLLVRWHNADGANAASLETGLSYSILCFRSFALPQLVLVILALTSFHVQIVNRISSGYPIWLMMFAMVIVKPRMIATEPTTSRCSQWVLRGMVTYAIVQGGLYASFLPPA